jgi:multisubunit Na+/H+ antiporter MnhC subunit
MEMFLMLFAMSLLGTAVSAALFAAATREEKQQPAPRAEKRPAEPQHFFVPGRDATATASIDIPGIDVPSPGPVPVETLLLQIERHIRLEQAAAESFHHRPTGESLHTRTASPLVN